MFDVIIIGGSYAGISAAIQLGRARRTVLVLDSGKRRNRFAVHSHGFLGQDGVPASEIAAKGKAEALAYPTVRFREALVTRAQVTAGGFAVLANGEELFAKRIILAAGVTDELPPIDGLADLWGTRVFHCPYCHGYELDRGKIGVVGVSPHSVHQALLVSEWSAPGGTTLFLGSAFEPADDEHEELSKRNVTIESRRIASVAEAENGVAVRLEDGHVQTLAGLFLLPRTHVPEVFSDQLGCELEDGPLGSFYKIDAMKETTVPGVFACGDIALPFGSVAIAVAEGVMAGTAAHRSLVFR